VSAAEDVKDIEQWCRIALEEPLSLVQKCALNNLMAMALKRCLEVEAMKEQLRTRRGLTLVAGGTP
jgi:hypothetical protein